MFAPELRTRSGRTIRTGRLQLGRDQEPLLRAMVAEARAAGAEVEGEDPTPAQHRHVIVRLIPAAVILAIVLGLVVSGG